MTPLWRFLPANLAHSLAPTGLSVYNSLHAPVPSLWKPFTWEGLQFRNRLGIAGGVDKNAENLSAWWHLGCGFVEIGTVTPLSQKANPGKILDRDWKQKALWNKMGFPSEGADEVYYNLLNQETPKNGPVFVNIGKNRATPNEMAISDYVAVVQKLEKVADAFVVNVSSPNTTGLRDLQNKESLKNLLSEVTQKTSKPVLVKLSPDLSEADLKSSLEAITSTKTKGLILTNTTLARTNEMHFPKEGGVSGLPLQTKSREMLSKTIQALGPQRKNLLIISVGGILTPEEIENRLSLGADLVQVYSALVFNGPKFFKEVHAHFRGAP